MFRALAPGAAGRVIDRPIGAGESLHDRGPDHRSAEKVRGPAGARIRGRVLRRVWPAVQSGIDCRLAHRTVRDGHLLPTVHEDRAWSDARHSWRFLPSRPIPTLG